MKIHSTLRRRGGKHSRKIKKPTSSTLSKNEEGFTLVELLLYIILSATIIAVVSAFVIVMIRARVKNQTITEVNEQGRQVMQILTQTIKNAEDINAPSRGLTDSALSLDVMNVSEDPTLFESSSGAIRMKQGSSPFIPLTNSRVVVSGVQFYNVSKSNTTGTVRIQFTLEHVNPSSSNEYDYSKTFYETATLR